MRGETPHLRATNHYQTYLSFMQKPSKNVGASIKCVIFDLDGTLYDYHQAADPAFDAFCEEGERLLGIPSATLRADFLRIGHDQWVENHETTGYHSRMIRCQRLLEERNLSIRHAEHLDAVYWKTYLDKLVPFPDAAAMLAELREMGLRLGVGTNMSADWQHRKLIRMGLIDWFDFMVTSEEASVEKPDPRFFAACVAKAKCSAGECLFVGDDPDRDARGALESGLRGVWLQSSAEARAARPDLQSISSLSEIPALVRK